MNNKKIKVEKGSDNVFADLGVSSHDKSLSKAKLIKQIVDIIEKNKITQKEAANLLGIDQPKISALKRGQLTGFSTERLFNFLNILGQDVQIILKAKPKSREYATISVVGV
jgi:predicted XRE-type DNA-binding protein